ncbi:MAG: hypothetical protein ABJN05_01355 [Sulfitobacter dubius]
MMALSHSCRPWMGGLAHRLPRGGWPANPVMPRKYDSRKTVAPSLTGKALKKLPNRFFAKENLQTSRQTGKTFTGKPL